ncbi:hypothetical protein HHL17_01305 [Chitinophaga sp. G-6-1-13]|uniref:Carboxypeptidase-like regulatory domain-containing protein n=1 Tax=Chitinophaga fulva TaxID=2728842 RepID=A0A848GGG1_9BACT|nr:carboxypeptidase-like regulatory domain-containing protein [Chitinophaga fulva]NML35820.1 hypothetical protein [Chitinophaga fulva]
MRKIPLTVSIPHPCHQPWEDMTPDTRGRFCGSCQKSVIDFSVLSDSQLIELLSDTSQKYCGRFKKSQLDRLILPEQQATSLLPVAVLGVMLSAGLPAIASAADNHQLSATSDTTVSRTITGKVTEKDGTVVPGTSVFIKGMKTGTAVNEQGLYQLSVPSISPEQHMTLVFSFIGFDRVEVPLTGQQTVDVVLTPAVMGGCVVVAGGAFVRKATPWQRLKYKWKRLWHR